MGNEQDSAIIREAQARYLKGERAALEDIYQACLRIAQRMITRQRQAKGFVLTDEQADEKAHNAAACIVERFMKKQGFYLKKPASYVYLCVLQELYHRRKVDTIVDFRDPHALEGVASD